MCLNVLLGLDACMVSWENNVQGVVESRTLEDNRGVKYTIVLFSRRSRLHPGMRYIARGLNSLASPGNEIECEQVHRPSYRFHKPSSRPL